MINILKNKINRNHPGTLDVHNDLLQSLFYEKLKEIKSCADFFKPYISTANENPGKFYVFLSIFVAPGISEKIAADADPYTIPFDKEATNELKSSLLKRLEDNRPHLKGKTLFRSKKSYMAEAVFRTSFHTFYVSVHSHSFLELHLSVHELPNRLSCVRSGFAGHNAHSKGSA